MPAAPRSRRPPHRRGAHRRGHREAARRGRHARRGPRAGRLARLRAGARGQLDFELTPGATGPGTRTRAAAPGDYPIDDTDSDITALIWNGVGGGSVVYAAHWQRNLPSDFRVRSLDGVGDDWPLSYEDLEPYYVRVERDLGVSGLPTTRPSRPARVPRCRRCRWRRWGGAWPSAHNELGWHWWPGPNAIATRRYGALNPCVQRATCLWGCADGAKASVDRTYWPGNLKRGRGAHDRLARPAARARRRAHRGRRVHGRRGQRARPAEPASRSWARTASARRGCSSCPATTAAWPTPPGSWASG